MARLPSALRQYRYAPRAASLSPVQWLIAQLISCGLADKDIAHLMNVSASTIKAHNAKTLKALGLVRRSQLVRYVFETGLFDPEAAEACLTDRRERRRGALALPSQLAVAH